MHPRGLSSYNLRVFGVGSGEGLFAKSPSPETFHNLRLDTLRWNRYCSRIIFSQEQTVTDENLTPMMRQYREQKERHPDAILLFRMGDFYEMFFDDAKTASKILDIALTTRDKNKEGSVPLCGFPHHAASGYISRLLAAGQRVAVCDQMEDPRQAKGIVRREVTRVLTPGIDRGAGDSQGRREPFCCRSGCKRRSSGIGGL